MDWIEKLIFYKDDLLVLGFHTVGGVLVIVTPCTSQLFHPSQTNMVLHSTVQNKHIMEVNCGGGHRSYGASSINEVSLSVTDMHAVYKLNYLTVKALFLR